MGRNGSVSGERISARHTFPVLQALQGVDSMQNTHRLRPLIVPDQPDGLCCMIIQRLSFFGYFNMFAEDKIR